MVVRNMRFIFSSPIILGSCFGWAVLWSAPACAANWYVRDGGGNPTQCTGTANAVYPGNGTNQPCAFSNPMYVLGAGCGNTGFDACDRPSLMSSGDTLYIVGDSDLVPGAQAQYPIGLDTSGVITPVDGRHCVAQAPEDCTMANMPSNSSVIGIGSQRPQLWGREEVVQVLNDNNSSNTIINNLEITQHSSCVTNGADPAEQTGGFPNACHKPNNGFNSPYGDYGLAGISLTGANITLENNWVHGMSFWGITTGNLSNFTETNNIINGNGGGGVGLGQNISNSGTMSLGGITTVNGDTIVFNGCGSVYPLHSSNPFDALNYHHCADDSSSNGGILADGWGMEAGTGICNNITMSNSIIAYNTKGGVDNLHCNGTGSFNAYRVRAEGNESQQMKLNYAAVNIENSQIINNCNFFAGQPFTTSCDSYGNCPPINGYDFCRAAGDGLVFAIPNNTAAFNVSNSTFYSNGGTNIELTTSWCSGGKVTVNVNNNLIVGAPDYTSSFSQQTRFWENDAGSCANVVENNNLVYQVNDPQDCAGSHDICNNPANAGVAGNFALNSSHEYTNVGLADQFYPAANSPLIGAGNSSLVLSGTSSDYNNNPRSPAWAIGSYQYGSTVADGGTCFFNAECTNNDCSNAVCVNPQTTLPSNPVSQNSPPPIQNPPAPAPGQPAVSITAPADGSSVLSTASVTITATASENNGSITQVAFYNGTDLLGTSLAAPYQWIAVNLPPGTDALTAVATDANGATATSAPVTIIVTAPALQAAPVVMIATPPNNSTFASGSNITFTSTASESNGTITQVSYYNGTNLLAALSNSPYSYTWNNVAAGTYAITAVATDANGATTTSAPVALTVTAQNIPTNNAAPNISISSPGNNASFTVPAAITFNATVTDSAQVYRVDYNAGPVFLGESTFSPYSVAWNSAQAGNYSVTAKATDSNGAVFYSTPINITVSAHAAPAVSLTSPSAGVSFNTPANITLTASASSSGGNITKVDFYSGSLYIGSAENSPYTVTWNNVQPGNYILTAKATDSYGWSSTSGAVNIIVSVPSSPPVVSISSPSNNAAFTAGNNITLNAAASENNGSITQVAFFNGNNLLGTDANSPYSFIWTNVPAGTYTITAVATDANNQTVTSAPISITVNAPVSAPPSQAAVNAPSISLTSPGSNASFTLPANIVLKSDVSDQGAIIYRVDYYAGSLYLGEANRPPYKVNWNSAQPGSYNLTAKAVDSNGNVFYASPVTVTVSAHKAPTISIAAPANNASFGSFANIPVTANAAVTGGSITKVDFYSNGWLYLGTAYNSPYTVTWNNVQPGNYTLTAKATDSYGWSSTSTPVSINVASNLTPPPLPATNTPAPPVVGPSVAAAPVVVAADDAAQTDQADGVLTSSNTVTNSSVN